MSFDRAVRLVGHDPRERRSFEAIVSLTDGLLTSFNWAVAGQAPVGVGDVKPLFDILYKNPDWIEALKQRGIEDPSKIHVDTWVTPFQPGMSPQGRIFCGIAFVHEDSADNHYARPVEGLLAYVDTDTGEVVVEDHGVVAVPNEPAEYAADLVAQHIERLKPLEITQPEARASRSTVTNSLAEVAVSILSSGPGGPGTLRHPLRRWWGTATDSVSSVTLRHGGAYGIPRPMHGWKHALDASETLLGHLANSPLGCDCLGAIRYFDATVLNPDGSTRTIENAVCLHEEDYGILWKHTNVLNPNLKPEVRRSHVDW